MSSSKGADLAAAPRLYRPTKWLSVTDGVSGPIVIRQGARTCHRSTAARWQGGPCWSAGGSGGIGKATGLSLA